MAVRWPSTAVAACAIGASLLVLCTLMASSASAQAPPPQVRTVPKGSNLVVIKPGGGKRNSKFTCTDTKKKRPGCEATCPSRCPKECLVLCPSCMTFCLCDFYAGASCGDPRFTGGDGNNFYFHGKKNQDFCILSDDDLHINAHFIGNHNPATSRDFTWIQAVGVMFAHHRLHLGAVRSTRWDSDVDHLDIAFDDEHVDLAPADGARWSSTSVPGLSITRTAQANNVVVELKGVFRIVANAVPITAEESKVHSYGVTADDCLAHLDLGFKFQALSDDVHGVLGQTYRSDYVNKLNVTSKMPVMSGTADYVSSALFASDCAVTRFGRPAAATARTAGGIAMVTDAKYV
ncbi:uncharacterized protein LOC119358802 [Triticum dicoccoides]|uniref:uncharacterized protein LOC119358802 n=1 Tax=Triticum dicoccoides TaxID=85692 RepID=UPI00188EF717|nr:uncharacterized protein LOC119358802 [Triticum dicoccoides]